jgi:hypothetical protein
MRRERPLRVSRRRWADFMDTTEAGYLVLPSSRCPFTALGRAVHFEPLAGLEGRQRFAVSVNARLPSRR